MLNEPARFQIALGFVVVLVCACFAFSEGGLLADPDTWWHIKSGSDIWHSGAFPTRDTYSYTFYGQPWIAKDWLSEVILYLSYALAGWNGVWFVATASICVLAIVIYTTLTKHLRPVMAAIATLAALSLTSEGFLARPHLLAMPLMVIWTYWLFQAAQQLRSPNFILLAVLVLWANMHAGFTLGFIIAFLAFLEFLERTRLSDRAALARWIIFLGLCPLVTLIHPYTYQAMLATFTVMGSNEAVPLITEWFPFNAQSDYPQEAVLLVLIFALMVWRVRFTFAKSLFLILILHMFLIHVRFAYVLFPLLPVVTAADIAAQFPTLSAANWRTQDRDPVERTLTKIFWPFVAAAMVVGAIMSILLLKVLPVKHEMPRGSGAIAYAKEHRLSGHVMNAYAFGGPLIFNSIPSYIDGRSDQLFQGGFVVNDDKMQRLGGEKLFLDALKKYDISWTLFSPKDARSAILDSLPSWKRVYSDEYAVIFVPVTPPP